MKHIVHRNTKTIFESDNNLFCLLTMNPHPVHTNGEYARTTGRYGRILVVGTLVFSLAVGLTVPEISFNAIANLGYWDVIHHKPVFINDTIRVESDIDGISYTSSDKKIVSVASQVYNQNDELVLSFKRKVLLPSEQEEEEL